MTEKSPIDGYGDGNCCPICGSSRIDVHHRFPLEVCIDLKTGKERFYQYTEKGRVYVPKPSNQMLAARYRISSHGESQVWYYECRKCGWSSELFIP